MLVPNQIMNVCWCASNKTWYITKGYTYTKFGDHFDVKVEDIPTQSHKKVLVFCDYCGKQYEIDYCRHITNVNNGKKDCCLDCKAVKTKETCTEKYGVDNPSKAEEIKDKIKQTFIDKYGVENVMQLEGVKEKIAETNMERYGNKVALNNPEIRAKAQETCKQHFGVDNPFSSEEIKEKIKDTLIEKYGVEYISQSDEIQEKVKQTCLEKWGVEYSTQATEVIEKMRESLCKNGNVKSSKPEQEIVKMVKDIYGEDCCKEQYQYGRINMDCLLTLNDTMIDIEYDGWYWHKDKKEYDKRRNYYLRKSGFKVLRIRAMKELPTKEQLIDAIDYLVNSNHSLKYIDLDIKDEDII